MMPRIFHGPGKRGSQSPKDQTKSAVHIMVKEGEFSLGYTSLGKPYTISQVFVPFNEEKEKKMEGVGLKISLPPDMEKVEENFQKFARKIKGNRHILIPENSLNIGHFIVGFHDKKLFIAYHPEGDLESFKNFLKEDLDLEKINLPKTTIQKRESQVKSSIAVNFDIKEYYRVCAKTAFNALCYVAGDEFVLRGEFDKIRDFILKGNDGNFVQFLSSEENSKVREGLKINKQAHSVFFTKPRNNVLAALLHIYGIPHLVSLSEEYTGPDILNGLICDWENKKEQFLTEYISENAEMWKVARSTSSSVKRGLT